MIVFSLIKRCQHPHFTQISLKKQRRVASRWDALAAEGWDRACAAPLPAARGARERVERLQLQARAG